MENYLHSKGYDGGEKKSMFFKRMDQIVHFFRDTAAKNIQLIPGTSPIYIPNYKLIELYDSRYNPFIGK